MVYNFQTIIRWISLFCAFKPLCLLNLTISKEPIWRDSCVFRCCDLASSTVLKQNANGIEPDSVTLFTFINQLNLLLRAIGWYNEQRAELENLREFKKVAKWKKKNQLRVGLRNNKNDYMKHFVRRDGFCQ